MGIVQETSTYECLEVRRRVQYSFNIIDIDDMIDFKIEIELTILLMSFYIRQETSTYGCLEARRRIHTTGDEFI